MPGCPGREASAVEIDTDWIDEAAPINSSMKVCTAILAGDAFQDLSLLSLRRRSDSGRLRLSAQVLERPEPGNAERVGPGGAALLHDPGRGGRGRRGAGEAGRRL